MSAASKNSSAKDQPASEVSKNHGWVNRFARPNKWYNPSSNSLGCAHHDHNNSNEFTAGRNNRCDAFTIPNISSLRAVHAIETRYAARHLHFHSVACAP
jgi:hypothetical protein